MSLPRKHVRKDIAGRAVGNYRLAACAPQKRSCEQFCPRQVGDTVAMLRAMKKTTRPILMIFSLVCMGLLPKAHAVSPPPDGDYPGGNTAEGFAALFSLTIGSYNTALGWNSLASDREGKFNAAVGAGTLVFNVADNNTATGAGALLNNTTGKENTANGAFALFSNTDGDFNTRSEERRVG